MNYKDVYNITDSFRVDSKQYSYCSLDKLNQSHPQLNISNMPNAVKIMTESIIRNACLDENEKFNIEDLSNCADFKNSNEVP